MNSDAATPQLTRAMQRLVRSLADVKGRRKAGLFVAEGDKCVRDTLGAFRLHSLYATPAWLERGAALLPPGAQVIPVGRAGMAELTSLSLQPDVMAVYALPEPAEVPEHPGSTLMLALDRVQDPGNLGTIIRTADWMGLDTILASRDTVDCFNPKCIQSTMGAIARVRVVYCDLPDVLTRADGPVFGTYLDGENIYTAALPPRGILVMGNEGRGIGPEVTAAVTRRLLIPSYPPGRPTSESLNVATATAIALSQFRARAFTTHSTPAAHGQD